MRQEAAEFHDKFDYVCPVDYLAHRMGDVAQIYTQHAYMRPIGTGTNSLPLERAATIPTLIPKHQWPRANDIFPPLMRLLQALLVPVAAHAFTIASKLRKQQAEYVSCVQPL